MEHMIFGLIKKRSEITGQHKAVVKAADPIKPDLCYFHDWNDLRDVRL